MYKSIEVLAMIALKLKNVFCPGKCVLLQILLVILVGCGGGGGGGGGEDDNGSFTFYSYSLKTPSGNSFSGTIDDAAKKISVSLPYGTSVTNLVASFSVIGTLSPTVTLKVDGNVQTSGVTGNDFSNPVTYHLTDDQGESADYTVEAVVSGKNAFVYVPKTLGSTISIYIIDDNTGKFMHSDTVSYTGSGDFTLYPEPKGRFMYLYDYSDSNTLKAYAINQLTGKLTVVSGSPYSLGTN